MRERGGYWSRRRLSRRRFLLGGGVAAAGSAAVLAGCGGGEPPAPTPSPTAVPTATPTRAPSPTPTVRPTPTASPTPDPNAPRRGGTLRLWKVAEDGGLDPGIFHINNTDVIYSTMTQPCTYQPTRNLFAMDGMTGYEQVDPTTLVWSVRPGMKFHNGDPVDAEAVAYSWGRLGKLYDALGATHVSRLGFEFVDAFEATDALTVTERWNRPNADALIHRSRHYYSFINPRMVEAFGAVEGVIERADGTTEDVHGLQELPFGSGSGPYVLTKRDATGTRVERWPDYHRHIPADDGFVEDGPYIDAWETRIIPDVAAAKSAFLAGELDAYTNIPADELPEFEELDHIAVTEVPNAGYAFLGMDGGKFHDKRARQALQKAFDYEGFIREFRPLGGRYAAPISDVLPHFQRLGQQELREWYRHDPAEARALWEAADFAVPVDQFRIYLWDVRLEPVGEFVARSLGEALGIQVELYSSDSCGLWHWCTPALNSDEDVQKWELLAYGSGEAGGTDGLPYHSQLIHFDPRGYGNSSFKHYIGSPRPEIDSDARTLAGMLEAQERILDADARADLLTGIQRWILDRHWCNWALPVSPVYHVGFSARLRDHAPDDWYNFYDRRRESMWLADDQPSGGST